MRAFPGAHSVQVTCSHVYVDMDDNEELFAAYDGGHSLRAFTEDFDEGVPVEPVDILLTLLPDSSNFGLESK